MRRCLLPLGAVFVAGCALRTPAFELPSPDVLPALRAELERDPTDVDLVMRTAAAHALVHSVDSTVRVLSEANEVVGGDLGILAALGAAEQASGEPDRAWERLQEALAADPFGPLVPTLRTRLDMLRPGRLRSEIATALAAPPSPDRTRPDPSLVLLLPFSHSGLEEQAAALNDLLIADLAQSVERVVDRETAAAIGEVLLEGGMDLTSLSTATRAGAILGAGRVIQGRILAWDDATWSVEARVIELREEGTLSLTEISVSRPSTHAVGGATGLAFQILRVLGAPLGPEGAAQIALPDLPASDATERFGAALIAWDGGAHAAAHRSFAEIPTPRSGRVEALAERAASAHALGTGSLASQIAEAARVSERHRALLQLRGHPESEHARIAARPVGVRSALAEALGRDRLPTDLFLEIEFTVPGGSP